MNLKILKFLQTILNTKRRRIKLDILITTPKSEIENSKRECKNYDTWFRTFKYKPNTEIGDKIYFTENGLIKGYGIIKEIYQSVEGEQCEETKRFWGKPGYWVIVFSDWHWLKSPVPFKGFQGIRYIDRIPELKNKLMEAD